MLIEDEGYVKPASRESRLVMVQLEPSAEKAKNWKRNQMNKNKNTSKKQVGKEKELFEPLKEACCDCDYM